tara:strand:+ start:180 stop:341 length:162 start_codon:yes stop_codon:yes gene_type:complete
VPLDFARERAVTELLVVEALPFTKSFIVSPNAIVGDRRISRRMGEGIELILVS